MKETISSIFEEHFGIAPQWIVRSPGRVNIIGEHTDYNKGFVLPAAIDKSAWLALSLRDDDSIHLYAADLKESYAGSLTGLKPLEPMNWPNYILGVIAQFQKKGISIKGFNAVLLSEVPIGAGLSSSAAIECATAYAINTMNNTGIERIELVKMAQKAEHEYAGVLCGIMDQFASMMGKADHAIRLDCDSLAYDYVPLKLDGVKIVLLNTNVKHSLASSEYNTRRQECERAVALIQEKYKNVSSLRDASVAMLDECVKTKDELAYKRGRFIVEEIARLHEACTHLQNGDLKALGRNMFATHDGLSKEYEVSCPELDWLVDAVRNNPSVLGSRMMGGGFGGCTINLVKEDAVDTLINQLSPAYEAAMKLKLTSYVAEIGEGSGAENVTVVNRQS